MLKFHYNSFFQSKVVTFSPNAQPGGPVRCDPLVQVIWDYNTSNLTGINSNLTEEAVPIQYFSISATLGVQGFN